MDQRRRKVARTAAGLSQSELAERLGVSQGYVSAIERGVKIPDDALKARIAVVLKVPVASLWPAEVTA